MEKLNRNIRQDNDVGAIDNDVGLNRFDEDTGSYKINGSPPEDGNDAKKFHDSQAAPGILKNTEFANIVRNKPNFYDRIDKKRQELDVHSREIYKEKIKLEIYKSDYEVFKSNMFELKSLIKTESQLISGFLTVMDFSHKLSDNNEKYKFR